MMDMEAVAFAGLFALFFLAAAVASLASFVLALIPPTRKDGRKIGIKSLWLDFIVVVLAIILQRGFAYGPQFSLPLSIAALLPLVFSTTAIFLSSKLKPPTVTTTKKTRDLILVSVVLSVAAAVFLLAYYFNKASDSMSHE